MSRFMRDVLGVRSLYEFTVALVKTILQVAVGVGLAVIAGAETASAAITAGAITILAFLQNTLSAAVEKHHLNGGGVSARDHGRYDPIYLLVVVILVAVVVLLLSRVVGID